MTTLEKNKLIAEFMGGKYDKDTTFPIHPNDIWLPIHGICRHNTIESGNGKILNYHNSWGWLMSVVEKIEDFYTINGEEIEFRVVQYEDEVLIVAKYQLKRWENIVEILSNGEGKFKNTYEAITQFIIWYNKNKIQ